MAFITFIEHSGEEHSTFIEEGKSLMQLAIDNSVPGIDADCGGMCACGTCHVIIDKKWIDAVGPADSEESMMLELTPDKTDTSRLSCQIKTNDEMDGMIVRLPEFQM
jgi:2Fe-2S ferredoxin|tara:strand:- start:605 stop:925 length:321 start_codon:yes stop_codon:yes gene_type:complete